MDQLIINFVELAVKQQLIDAMDKIYIKNQLLELLNKKEIKSLKPKLESDKQLLDMLDELVEQAVRSQVIPDLDYEREILSAKIMNLLTPLPSKVNEDFWHYYKKSPEKATDYFYQLGKQTNYIKTREIAKNKKFTVNSEFGPIELTINLSKPEKDPRAIKLAAQSKKQTYPANALSFENEGYSGSSAQPARSNHRLIRLTLHNEEWGLQYSPYVYYPEHCIFLSMTEKPMGINVRTVSNLLEIVDKFPHYFVGANAGLPIVGGSILTHDHYQGGRYTFPIEYATVKETYTFEGFSDTTCHLLNWPMSVLRFESRSSASLIKMAEAVFSVWENYTDESVDIYSETDGEQHNAITSIVRKKDEIYQMYLVLRNNRTSEKYPDGIFHAHPESQHIKKENIGLIEVMGLAILPPRLKDELQQVRNYLLKETSELPVNYQSWVNQLAIECPQLTEHSVNSCIQQAVGDVYIQILKDASVFKLDKKGQAAFLKFIQKLTAYIENEEN